MSVYNGVDGTVLTVTKTFLDDDDNPLMARPGYPQVRLRDSDRNLLSQVIASPTNSPGEWTANVAVPNLGLLDKTEFRLKWLFKTTNDEKIVETDAVLLEPKHDSRVADIVTMYGDDRFSVVLPLVVNRSDEARFQIYKNNVPMLAEFENLNDLKFTRTATVDRTHYSIPLTLPGASLQAGLLVINVIPKGSMNPKTFTYKLWSITPQIALAMSMLEDFLDKAKVSNVIPELRYQAGDLILYLERGLNLLNQIQQPSHFNGLNMQGVLLDAWITCASYYALGAQLMAEGALAFDFSGQGISLNVDRTPQLEGALGRIEQQIDSRVTPLKKYLWKQGITSGDGSIGSKNMNNPASVGILEISNSPVTRVNGLNGFGRRSRGWGW